MSNALLSSKIVVTEEPPRISTFASRPTAVLGMVGITERGPIGKAVLCTSFEEFANVFGGYTLESKDTVAAVEGFYEEGGQFLWFTRTCRYTDINDPDSAEALTATGEIDTVGATAGAAVVLGNLTQTFSLADGDTLVVSVDGAADDTSTFNAGPAQVTSALAQPFVLADGQTLTISIDGEPVQTVTFNTAEFVDITLATALEVAAVINAETTDILAEVTGGNNVRLRNTRGIGTGFDIEVTGGTAAAAFNFTAGVQTGTGDAADAAAVTVAELKTLFEADITGITVTNVSGAVQIATTATGAARSLQIKAASTLDTKLGLSNLIAYGNDLATATPTLRVDAKYPGEYGNDVTVRIAAASSGDADRFNLLVLEDGFVKEQFPNLTMDDAALGYVEDVINAEPGNGGSLLISVTDLDAALGSATLDRPANGDTSLAGGTNGLTNIGDVHFVGSEIAKNGLRALDVAEDITLLAVPARATAVVANAMLTYCEVTRNGTMLAIIDPPAGLTAQGMVAYVESALLLEASEYGAVYFPRVKVLNPNTTLFGVDDAITVPPSGHVAGRISRTDNSAPGGIYQPPAGLSGGRFSSIVGLEILAGNEVSETFDVTKRDLLYPKRINPISEVTGGRIIDGVRTLKSTGNFPTIAERRGVIFIERTIKANLEQYRFRNNDDALRAEVTRSVEAFLIQQMNVGAFRSNNPRTAFSVDFGEGLNPPSVVFAGQLIGRIGLATQKPAEFVILKFTQDTRALEQEINQP